MKEAEVIAKLTQHTECINIYKISTASIIYTNLIYNSQSINSLRDCGSQKYLFNFNFKSWWRTPWSLHGLLSGYQKFSALYYVQHILCIIHEYRQAYVLTKTCTCNITVIIIMSKTCARHGTANFLIIFSW